MDTTIRNLDPQLYRRLKARAAVTGKTVGEAVNEALRVYLAHPSREEGLRTLRELRPEPYGPDAEQLSEEIDTIAYGA
jgi:plasmid stability protein